MIRCLLSLVERGPIALLWRALAEAHDERDEAVEEAARLALDNDRLRRQRAEAVRKGWQFKAERDAARRDFAELVESWPTVEERET